MNIKTENKLIKVYNALFERYGNLNWWPAKSPYEVTVGAILTQNTNWSNVEKAIANFKGGLTPEYIEKTGVDELAGIIHPSGFHNQKAIYLKTFAEWYKKYGYSVESVRKFSLEKIRGELLALKGIGQETADSILLYAFSYPVFVVDAYTKRLLERLPIDIGCKPDYNSIKTYFETKVPPELYNNYHALIVINAKEHCRKKPLCSECPLKKDCAAFKS